MVQWLRFHASNAGGPGSNPGRGKRIPHAMGHGQKEEKEKITLNERSQTQKDKNWKVSLIWGPYYHLSHLGLPRCKVTLQAWPKRLSMHRAVRFIETESVWNGGCQGLGRGQVGMSVYCGQGFSRADGNVLEVMVVTMWCSAVCDSCDPTDCRLPGSSANGISQARTLEWGTVSSSRGSFPTREDQTCISGVSCLGRQALYQ